MPSTKDRVLLRLLKSDDYVSGEEISHELNISRAAVNTAVKSIKNDGYTVESVTNKGYRITGDKCVLSAGRIMSYHTNEREGEIIVLDTVDSTNNYLRSLALGKKATFCDVVIAVTQTGGRGRLGRCFSSKSGKGLYLSYLMNPAGISTNILSEVTAWSAVAVKRAILRASGVDADIKWVNDLVFDSKKLCGILTELFFVGEGTSDGFVIIGIGINVNHGFGDFSEDISDIATSLKIIYEREIDISKLSAYVIEELDRMVCDFPSKKGEYLEAYRTSCKILGKRCRIIKGENERVGTVVAVDDNFGLIIDFDDGKRETVTGGEVSVRGFYGYI